MKIKKGMKSIMITKELSEAAVEMNYIFDNMSAEVLKKIPKSFRQFFKEIESKKYIFKYDKSKKLAEQKLLPETKGIIALMYRDYLCNEIEKQKYNEYCKKILEEEERKKIEKYNPNNIFKEKNKITPNQKILPTEYKKESLIKRIFNKIKRFFVK